MLGRVLRRVKASCPEPPLAQAQIRANGQVGGDPSSADRQDESRDVPDDPGASPGQHVRPTRRRFCVEEVDVTLLPRIRDVLVEQRPRRNVRSIGLGDHDVDDEAAEERVAPGHKAMGKPRGVHHDATGLVGADHAFAPSATAPG